MTGRSDGMTRGGGLDFDCVRKKRVGVIMLVLLLITCVQHFFSGGRASLMAHLVISRYMATSSFLLKAIYLVVLAHGHLVISRSHGHLVISRSHGHHVVISRSSYGHLVISRSRGHLAILARGHLAIFCSWPPRHFSRSRPISPFFARVSNSPQIDAIHNYTAAVTAGQQAVYQQQLVVSVNAA